MTRLRDVLVVAAIFPALFFCDVVAQRPNGAGRERRQRDQGSRFEMMMKRIPLFMALDKDGDGEISSLEIENAASALLSLDTDGDGKLSSSEMLPNMNGMRRGQGGRGRQTGNDGAPKVGDEAPTFKLKSLDGNSETDLADFKNSKPVVLFFGSYT